MLLVDKRRVLRTNAIAEVDVTLEVVLEVMNFFALGVVCIPGQHHSVLLLEHDSSLQTCRVQLVPRLHFAKV